MAAHSVLPRWTWMGFCLSWMESHNTTLFQQETPPFRKLQLQLHSALGTPSACPPRHPLILPPRADGKRQSTPTPIILVITLQSHMNIKIANHQSHDPSTSHAPALGYSADGVIAPLGGSCLSNLRKQQLRDPAILSILSPPPNNFKYPEIFFFLPSTPALNSKYKIHQIGHYLLIGKQLLLSLSFSAFRVQAVRCW